MKQTDKFQIGTATDPAKLRSFTQRILRDLRALGQLIDEGWMDTGARRIGAEQELVLVDRAWCPAPIAMQVLDRLDDEHFTTELALFNLEFNADPVLLGADCLTRLEETLGGAVAAVQSVATRFDTSVVLAGILPTLRQSDLDLRNMTPLPRYRNLNDALCGARGSAFELRLRGSDEISITHDSVMLEACNTSCQIHLQVAPDEFARLYNIAQVVAAPVLAAACNAPMLFGKRLWHETRIAVFEQSIDTRRPASYVQDRSGRVRFGERWVRDSVLEIFEEDISRFRVFMTVDEDEDPAVAMADGRAPRLRALNLHNGTVYRWNRPCYGILDGTPHLRIENRVLPAGPTIADEVANAAFWIGLMLGLQAEHEDVTKLIAFDDARANFVAAARLGLDAHLRWIDGRRHAAPSLVCDHLIEIARRGLGGAGVNGDDADRFLEIVDRRTRTGHNGAEWQLESFASMNEAATHFDRARALVAAMSARQREGLPVHAWAPARFDEIGESTHGYERVGQYMTTDVLTVHQDEVVDLVTSVMAWRRIRHVPVEDDDRMLVGIISVSSLLEFIAKARREDHPMSAPVSEILQRDPVVVAPDTPTLEALELMQREGISCLPVVTDGHLVGIVSEHDLLGLTARLLRAAARLDARTDEPG